jgi:LysR family glycine cleavage system transcriptional activator
MDASRDYQIVYPAPLRDDPAVRAFCDWLHAEIAALRQRLTETAAADR